MDPYYVPGRGTNFLFVVPLKGGWEAWCTALRGGHPGKAWEGQQGLLSGWSPRAHSAPGSWSLRWAGRVPCCLEGGFGENERSLPCWLTRPVYLWP